MSEPGSAQPEVGYKDRQIGAFFNVVGQVSRDPDPNGFGYFYDDSISERVGEVSIKFQDGDGLSRSEVFERFMAASELAVLVRQHVESRILSESVYRFN